MAESLVFDITARDRASSTFSKVGHAAGLLGVAIGALAIKVGRDSVKGYRDHMKVAAITGQVIKTTGGAANVSAKQVEGLSDAIEAKTGVDGDAIQSGANLLLTFTGIRNEVGKGNAIFNRATGTITDMSVALGTDAKSSAIQLGKALNDPIKGVSALQRVGVSFDESQKAHIKTMVEAGNTLGAQKVILRELGKEFGGAAAAAATPADKLQASYHRLQDSIGAALIPALDSIETSLVQNVMPPIIELVDKHGPALVAMLGTVGTKVGAFFAGFKGGNTKGLSGDLSSIGESLQALGPKLKEAAHSLPSFSDGVHVASVFVGFLADHLGLLGKAMPFIIAGLVAYAAAQVVSNTVGRNSLIGFGLQIISTLALAASNRTLSTSMLANAGATAANTTAGTANIVVTTRGTVATIAHAVASKVAAGATKVWAAGQWLLNAALTANPIGLAVVAIAALVVGIIYAYKHSETFRNIVHGAFHAVAEAGQFMWDVLKRAFSFLVNTWLTVAGTILHGAEIAFGWIPIIGDKLHSAAGKFNQFAATVRAALSGGAEIGANFVRGVASGIRATTGLAVGAAGDMSNRIAAAAKQQLQERSPSKVGIEIGAFFAEGVGIGIKDKTAAALEAVQALTDKVIGKLDALKEKAKNIRTTAADAVRGMFNFGDIGAVTTGTDAEGNATSTTASPVQQFADFAAQSKAFAGAVSAALAHTVDSRIVTATAATGNLTAVQALAALNPASVASVNRDFALAQKFAAQVGQTVLSTTPLPDQIAREQGQLDTLKAIRADLKAQRPIEIHVHDVTDPDAVVAAIRRYIKKNGLLRNVAAP